MHLQIVMVVAVGVVFDGAAIVQGLGAAAHRTGCS